MIQSVEEINELYPYYRDTMSCWKFCGKKMTCTFFTRELKNELISISSGSVEKHSNGQNEWNKLQEMSKNASKLTYGTR